MLEFKKLINGWQKENFPFSFIYNSHHFSEINKNWKIEKKKSDKKKTTEYSIIYKDPETGLIVNLSGIEYKVFPVVEWVLHLKNTSSKKTPVIEKILPLDWEIKIKENPVLHYHIGSPTGKEDYKPLTKKLKNKTYKEIKTSGGRPSNKYLPYFNLEFKNSGIIMAIGWPGQWKTEFKRDAENLRIKVCQEYTHFTLYPGEEVRTPLIVLLFYDGDRVDGQNVWRKWMIKHNLPKIKGKLPHPMLSGGAWFYFAPYGYSNSQTIKVFIDNYKAKGINIDNWWIDAGWYKCDYSISETGYSLWTFTGTWKEDRKRFPGGISEISDYAHKNGLKLILWFEPERVMPKTEIFEKHPEFLLNCKKRKEKLLNFGNSEALKWILKRIDKIITENKIDIYREDFNIDPLPFWLENDKKNRKGITEIKYVMGHLKFWDELRKRHPEILIDTCASGGKRIDIETLRRAVPLWRSDYTDFPGSKERINANQCITFGISFWVPYYGTGITSIEKYRFRSYLSPSLVFDLDPRSETDFNLWHKLIEDFKKVAEYFYGDFYPLTEYNLKENDWIAWQFNRPEKGDGLIQVFRREKSRLKKISLKLRGLVPHKNYLLEDIDTGENRKLTGKFLMEKGVKITLDKKPEARIFIYHIEKL